MTSHKSTSSVGNVRSLKPIAPVHLSISDIFTRAIGFFSQTFLTELMDFWMSFSGLRCKCPFSEITGRRDAAWFLGHFCVVFVTNFNFLPFYRKM